MKIFSTIIIISFFLNADAQIISAINVDPDSSYENIFVKKLYSDSTTTTSLIWIKNEVVLHKHLSHTEQVIVLEGRGEMQLDYETKEIKPGDIIFIPKNTPHGVKVISFIPLKVLSIQAPEFDGGDRVVITR